jgi:hypothetical protein
MNYVNKELDKLLVIIITYIKDFINNNNVIKDMGREEQNH